MEKDLFLERVKHIMDYKTPEYGYLISEQQQLKSFSLGQKSAAELANMFKMSIDDVRNAAKLATDTKAFNKAIAKDIAAGVQGTVGPAAKLLSKQKTIQELLKSGKLSADDITKIIERNKRESLNLVQKYSSGAAAKAGSTAKAGATAAASSNKVITVLGQGWKTMSTKKAIALLVAGGATVAAIVYFLKNKKNPLPDCVINKLTEQQLKTLGDTVVFKTTGVKTLDAYGGIILMDNGTCTTGNGKYKGTYSCSGNNILVKMGNNEYTILGGTDTTVKETPPPDKTKPSEKVKQIQQMLVRSGYYIGNTGPSKDGVDGYYGKKTDAAYKAWEGKESAEDFNNRVYKMGKTTQQGGTTQGTTTQGGTTQGTTTQGTTTQGGTQQGGTQQGTTTQGGTTQGGGDREINIVNPDEF